MKSINVTASLPGAGITLATAAISFLASTIHPSFDSLVISIIFGMLASNILGDRDVYAPGVELSLKVFLPVGISLYGLQLVFIKEDILQLPSVAAVVVFMFVTSYFISRGFGLPKGVSTLISTGLSVCGASAIAVVSPLMGAKKEDTSVALITVVTLGLTGMLFYSLAPGLLGLTLEKFAFLTGMTLPMFGQVKIAAASMGEESLQLASHFKLLRISSLLFVAMAVMFMSEKKSSRFYVPAFMVVFFALAALANLSEQVARISVYAAPVSKFSMTAALAAIGLSIDLDSVTSYGTRPLFSAFLSWGIVVLSVYIVIFVINV